MERERTHYEVLGIPRDADGDQIRRAFRRAVKTSHPDGGGAGNDEFTRITDAYHELRDSSRRRRYDLELRSREGLAGPSQWIVNDRLDSFAVEASWGLSHLFDLFGGVIGSHQWWDGSIRCATDAHFDVELSPVEAASGVQFSVDVTEQDLAASAFSPYVRPFICTIPVTISAGVMDGTVVRYSFRDGDGTPRILQLLVRVLS